MELGMVDYVRDPTPHDTLVRVVQCGWSGQIGDLSHSFLFLFLFLLSLTVAAAAVAAVTM